MNSQTFKPANIKVNVITYELDSQRIPKLIEVYNQSLKVVWSQWYQSNNFDIDIPQPGIYTLRLSLSSGVQKDETIDVKEGETKEIQIDISNNSPHESHEWAYFNKNFTVKSMRNTDMKNIPYYNIPGSQVDGKLWVYRDGDWQQELSLQFTNQAIRDDGYVFADRTQHEISFLEISGKDMPNLYVSLPPGNDYKCLVKLADIDDEEIHPIDVQVSTDHYKAETLLTLLTNGAIREAKSLSNAKEAEELLYQKMRDPVTAAIGGYFLLKIGELERLHDWANNLAHWFDWLPDGAIIHATQLLNQKEKTQDEIDLIRQRLLHASNTGLPVYSEGIRLLEKGLSQLWYHSKQTDDEVKKALLKTGNYLEAMDCSQETTTFIGKSPTEPGRPKR